MPRRPSFPQHSAAAGFEDPAAFLNRHTDKANTNESSRLTKSLYAIGLIGALLSVSAIYVYWPTFNAHSNIGASPASSPAKSSNYGASISVDQYSNEIVSQHLTRFNQNFNEFKFEYDALPTKFESVKNADYFQTDLSQLSVLYSKQSGTSIDESQTKSEINGYITILDKLVDLHSQLTTFVKESESFNIQYLDNLDKYRLQYSAFDTHYQQWLQLYEKVEKVPHSIERTQMELNQSEASRNSIQSELDRIDNEMSNYLNNKRSLESKIDEIRLDIQRTNITIDNQRSLISQLNSELSDTDVMVTQRLNEMSESENRKSQIDTEINALQSDIRDLETKKTEKNMNIQSLQNKITIRDTALTMFAQITSDGNIDDIIDYKSRQIDILAAKLTELQNKYQISDSDSDDSDSHKNNDDDDEDTVSDVMNVVKWAQKEEIRNVRNQIETEQNFVGFYRQLAAKGTKKQTLESEMVELQKQMSTFSESMSDLERQLSELRSQLAAKQSDLDGIIDFLNNSQSRLTEFENTKADIQTRINESTKKQQELSSNLEALQSQLSTYESQLIDDSQSDANKDNKRSQLQSELSETNDKMDSKKLDILSLLAQQNGLFYDLQDKQETVLKLVSNLNEYQKIMEKQKSDLSVYQKTFDTIMADIKSYIDPNAVESV